MIYGIQMKIYALFIFVVFVFMPEATLAMDANTFAHDMSYFYVNPTQESFDDLQKTADQLKDDLNKSGNGANILISAMFAKISQKYDWPIVDSAFSSKAKEILDEKTTLSKYINDDSQVDPKKLDIWWTSFFATGDNVYLEKIFQYSGLELPKSDLNKMLLIGAAKWSFRSNCKQHKKVLEFAKQKLTSTPITETQKSFLMDCITFAETDDTKPVVPSNVGPPTTTQK